MSTSSCVPDHCRPFALSHKSDEDFTTECDQLHDLRCDLIPSVFDEVELALKDSALARSSEDKKEMEYVICESKKNIQAWKAHLLRAINQDETRLNLLQGLNPPSVLVVLDWAMKFLPRKYHESQDNAGCYHNAFNLLAVKELAKRYQVEFRVDFSDPQGGKGSCDRKAGHNQEPCESIPELWQ